MVEGILRNQVMFGLEKKISLWAQMWVRSGVGVRTTGTDKNIKIYNNISNSEFANIVHILVRPETNDS